MSSASWLSRLGVAQAATRVAFPARLQAALLASCPSSATSCRASVAEALLHHMILGPVDLHVAMAQRLGQQQQQHEALSLPWAAEHQAWQQREAQYREQVNASYGDQYDLHVRSEVLHRLGFGPWPALRAVEALPLSASAVNRLASPSPPLLAALPAAGAPLLCPAGGRIQCRVSCSY